MLGGFLLKGLVGLGFRSWLLGVMMRQQVDTSRELLEYYLAGPYSLHAARHTGELLRNCTDSVGRAYSSVAMGAINIVTEAVTITAVLGLLMVVAPLPTLMLVVYFAVAAFASLASLNRRFARTVRSPIWRLWTSSALRSMRWAV